MIPYKEADVAVKWNEIYQAFITSLRNRTIVEDFEREFANYIGTEHAVTFSNGRIGLLALLNFYKRKTMKREVIAPAYTCIVVPNVILQAGLKLVFVDIELETYGPDPVQVIDKISDNTLAVIPTDMFGQVCDIEPIVEGAKDTGVTVIEDAALALGAAHKGVKAGCFGDVSFFSLNVAKNITTFDGGVVATNDKELFQSLKSYQTSLKCTNTFYQFLKVLTLKFLYSIATNTKVYGTFTYPAFNEWKTSKFLWKFARNWNIDKREEYTPKALGKYKSALGLLQLSKLDWLNSLRREIAEKYNSKLKNESWLDLPKEKRGNYHVYAQYAILLKPHLDGDSFMRYLVSKGVRGTNLFSYSCPSTPALMQQCKSDVSFPNSLLAAGNIVNLPNSPFLDNQKIDYISNVVSSFSKESKELQ